MKTVIMMTDSKALARILAYLAEKRLNMALKDNDVTISTFEAIVVEESGEAGQPIASDCIYDEEPLGFEKTQEMVSRI